MNTRLLGALSVLIYSGPECLDKTMIAEELNRQNGFCKEVFAKFQDKVFLSTATEPWIRHGSQKQKQDK